MNLRSRYCVVTALLCALLAGCEDSEVGQVKAANDPVDATHTYGSVLSERAACKATSWKKFKDDSNRTAVEYRCELDNAVAALNKVRDAKIDEINGYLKASNDNLGKAIEGSAGDAARYAKLLEEKKAELQQIDEKSQAQTAGMDGPSALKAKQVWDTARAYAASEVERYQAELDKANSGANTASLEASRQSYQQRYADDIANLHKQYDGVKSVTEVIRWVVNDKAVIPVYYGFEIDSALGNKTSDKSSQFSGYLQQIARLRGQDYVAFVAPNVLVGIAATTDK
ncbi:hypothetical protein [Pandoraea fibrosis]|uniref:Lipoprotein n=1 Tax=Pandoraea fibrosis TaxID=1891094 RepID=A0A5E4Z1Q8_9BURK|nr:hypothetical protein [Pandoraea fibrosis]VVE55084.1 hypothetical protein PFI31113_04952 [Pandoraea fibrosis]